jgi:ADP-heptose:LPS heptosyltransferase
MFLNDTSKKSYAIFVRNSYGDLLMTDPLIKYIKNLNRKNIISLFVDDKNFQLIEFMENIDHYYVLPSKGNKYLIFSYYGLKYRKNNYDFSIAAKTGVGSANGFFQYMLGAKKQISYTSQKKTWTDKLINHPITFSEEIYHNQHYAVGVLQLLNPKIKEIPNALFPKLIKHKKNINNIKPNLLISVSNNRDCSRLNNANLAIVINLLNKEFDFNIYISSLITDLEIAKDLKKRLTIDSSIRLTPNLKDFIELLNSMDICFLGDGGTMHFAAALEIPQVVLFGHTSPLTWGPLSNHAKLFYDSENVNNIELKKILEALKNKLNNIKTAKTKY